MNTEAVAVLPAMQTLFPALAAALASGEALKVLPLPPGQTSTALAVRAEVVASTLLVSSALSIMSLYFQSDDNRKKRKRADIMESIRRRLYCEPGTTRPQIVLVRWNAVKRPNGTYSLETTVNVNIDGHVFEPKVVPLIIKDLDFDMTTVNVEGGIRRRLSNGEFHCFLIRPDQDDESKHWHAFLIGLCPKPILEEFNKPTLATGGRVIPHLPNHIGRLGTLHEEWTPTHNKMTKQHEILLGYECGKMIVLKKGTDFPRYKPLGDDPDQIEEFLPSVFRRKEYANKIVVTYLGAPGEVNLDSKTARIEQASDDIDPYQTVGWTPSQLDPDGIDERVSFLKRTVSTPDNPAVLYAQLLGYVKETDDLGIRSDQTHRLLDLAREKLAEEAKAVWYIVSGRVHAGAAVLRLSDVADGKSAKQLRFMRSGENAVTKMIAESLGAAFDWEVPIHRRLYKYCVDIVSKNGE